MSLAETATLAKAFRDPTFLNWSREDQFDQREAVNSLVASHMAKRGTSEWEATFATHGMWCARVNSYDDVLADPQLVANQSIIELDDPSAGHVRLLAHPVRYDGKAPGVRRPPPSAGQHTGEVLLELGYEAEDLESLRRSGAIGPDRARAGFDRKASAPASSYGRKAAASQ